MTNSNATSLPHGRWDIYGPVHKGLRLAATDLMIRLGRADPLDEEAMKAVLGDLAAHLALAATHLAHEEAHIHPALAERNAAAATRLSSQHADHRTAFAELDRLIGAAALAAPHAAAARMRELYLAFSAFVADDLVHMHEEETVTWPLLCALFSDEQLAEIEMSIIATLSPEENVGFMRLMIPAMNRQERAALLGGVKASAPPEAFAAVLEAAARPTLSDGEFAELGRDLALAA
ncbi:hypothetical protein [Phenylobacterium sp.]|uniref:hypothetical protein n=1 Tax=Phenylobacterium sp. TaxID=1871053 RepID=UPI0035B107BE